MTWSDSLSTSQSIRCLSGLRNIRHLELTSSADDFFLQQLSNTCQHLSRLDVSGSKSVTDRCLPSLEEFSSLVHLDLWMTSVTEENLGLLLLKMTGVTSLGQWNSFGLLLSFPRPPISNLANATASRLDQNQLSQLVSSCPGLTQLSLSSLDDVTRLTVLGRLDQLAELKISGIDFKKTRLGVSLLAISSHLEKLELESVTGLDTQDIRNIGTHADKLSRACVPPPVVVLFSVFFFFNL